MLGKSAMITKLCNDLGMPVIEVCVSYPIGGMPVMPETKTFFDVHVYPVIRATKVRVDGDTSPDLAVEDVENQIATTLSQAGPFMVGGFEFEYAEQFSGAMVDVIEGGERVGDGIGIPASPELAAQAKEHASTLESLIDGDTCDTLGEALGPIQSFLKALSL